MSRVPRIAGVTAVIDTFPDCMKLAKLFDIDHIILDMEATDHSSAIVELIDRMVKTGKLPGALREQTLESLLKREELVSTGIGGGVAIPHAFSDDLDDVVAVFGRSDQGIDFEALDGAPVHLIVLFIVPRRDYQLHLQTLAAIAKTFTNPALRAQLRTASSREEVLSLLGVREPKPSPVRRAAAALVPPRPWHASTSPATA